ncbi:MAG: polyprenol monophosphomannose synthase [Anaerolineae bacterium]
MRTAVVVPTYNESDNIETLVEAIMALGTELQIIIVDDNSPDGTGQMAEALAKEHAAVHVLHRPTKMGLGTAYIAGFKQAFALGAERIMTMDADFSHHPRYIPQLLAKSDTHDLVIGSRYVDGGGIRYWDMWRRVLSRTANAFARMVLGLKAHDCTAGFRCYRRQVLESIDLDQIFSDGYSFLVEMLYKCQQRGYLIAEVPIIFEDRRRGASKISRQEIFKAMYTVFRLRWEKSFNTPLPQLKDSKGSSPWNT